MASVVKNVRVFIAAVFALAGAGFAAETASGLPGTFSLNIRARYEAVEQTGLREGEAVTVRTRLGFTTATWEGFRAMVEAENISAVNGDHYSQAGLNPAAGNRAAVADPEVSEVNQGWIGYTFGHTALTLGRQRLVLDNARFVGDVGWRQNMQTFDAFTVQDKTLPATTLTYSYLNRINRVFGPRHPQGHWEAAAHVLNAARAGLPGGGTLTAYGYLLDFDNAAVNSCATWGASYAGAVKLPRVGADARLVYRAELARQTDYGSSPLNYAATYRLLEVGGAAKRGSLSGGYEVLGSDHNVGFKTPLATLHAFNGWADLFLTTPGAGLRDRYVKATAELPAALSLTAFYHWFDTATTHARLGTECDALLARKFGKRFTGLVKVADFRRDSVTVPNVRKLWIQVEWGF
jgi:hypothetical protein